MLFTCTCSFVGTDEVKIMGSRDEQCNTKESP